MTHPKITLIGAGSTVFAKNLIGDLLSYPELAGATLTLYDVDAERLKTSEVVARGIADVLGAKPKLEATTDRSRALDGADYAISMFQVAGYKPGTVTDFDVPKKYGLEADHRRHAGYRRHHARAAHDSRVSGVGPRDGKTLPGRDAP